MAEIVLGIGTSHGPMLSTPWEKWAGRVAADKQLAEHDFRGSTYSFDELVALRQNENLAEQITPEKWQERSEACRTALDTLAAKYAEVAPDVAVIVGNDQRELFMEDNFRLFRYSGETAYRTTRAPRNRLPPCHPASPSRNADMCRRKTQFLPVTLNWENTLSNPCWIRTSISPRQTSSPKAPAM